MVPNFLEAVRQIKADLAGHLSAEAIVSECRAIGYTWRERWLGPVRTVHLFLLQVLHGNTACDHVPRLGGVPVTGKAYGDARARLPLELFERLLRSVCQSLGTSLDEGARWCGHRLWLVDGSSCSMPDTEELQTAFGQPGGQRKGCGFPVAHLIVLIHAATGLLQQLIAAPLRMHDMTLATRVQPPRALRTARPQAQTEAVLADEKAAPRTHPSLGDETTCGLTSCHSGLSPFLPLFFQPVRSMFALIVGATTGFEWRRIPVSGKARYADVVMVKRFCFESLHSLRVGE